MPIANGLALPNPLSNGTTADAVQVMGDFNYLLSAVNRALLDAGGGAGMNAQSTQIHNLANGTSANDAVNLSQLGGYAALLGATFTGALNGTTLTLSGLLTAAALTLSGNAVIGGMLNVTGIETIGGAVNSTGGFGVVANNVGISFRDTFGGTPVFVCQNDNNFCFYGTDATGAARGIFGVAMHSSTSSLGFNIPINSPTPTTGDNSTLVATTAFVQGAKAPSTQAISSAATITPAFSNDMVTVSALATNATIANATGTAVDGWGIVLRIKDNGTARTLSWGTAYRGIGLTLPTTTVISKNLYVGMVWNNADSFWDVLSVIEQ